MKTWTSIIEVKGSETKTDCAGQDQWEFTELNLENTVFKALNAAFMHENGARIEEKVGDTLNLRSPDSLPCIIHGNGWRL